MPAGLVCVCATLGSVPLVAYGPQNETYQYGISATLIKITSAEIMFRYTEAVARRLYASCPRCTVAAHSFTATDSRHHVRKIARSRQSAPPLRAVPRWKWRKLSKVFARDAVPN
jgi:hypothetical protein